MTNDQKRLLLMGVATALQDAQQGSSEEKLMLKLKARDAIEKAIAGTVAQSITSWLQNEIAPHCEPFGEVQFLKMAALAGAVEKGKEELMKAYGERIFQADLGL